MDNYAESKAKIEEIGRRYACKGDIIMRTAVQYIVECGQQMFRDNDFVAEQKAKINARHDEAEAQGHILLMTRDFEYALIDCAAELAEIDTYNLVIFMQKEMFWSNEGGMDYQRMLHLLEETVAYINAEACDCEPDVIFDILEDCGFEEEEMAELGYVREDA